MSQEISTSPRMNPLLIANSPAHPWSADSDAEHLMDEVFFDLDRILAGGASLPEAPAPEPSVALQTLVVPPLSLPAGFLPTEPVAPKTETVNSEVKANPNRENYFDRLLLGAALAAVGASGVLWLVSKDILKLPFLPPAPTPVASQPVPVNPADGKFIDYMQRSLTAIDRRATSSPTALQSGSKLPAPGGVLLPTQAPPTVLERVYIPVFPPQMSNPALPISPGLLTPRPSISLSPRPSNSAAPKATSNNSSNNSPAPRAETAEPQRPERRQSSGEERTAPVEAPSVATASRTLTGVLELGDSSAALFDINGTTQRVGVGEAIGDSGWTLVKVENQQAIIRRNGTVQSLYVGGRF